MSSSSADPVSSATCAAFPGKCLTADVERARAIGVNDKHRINGSSYQQRISVHRRDHPGDGDCAGQRIFVVHREDYVYWAPFVDDEHSVFLKTIIPSRKATRQ